jgi:hypothetical protein
VRELVEPIHVEADAEVEALVGLILDVARTEPVVCLTSRPREREPSFDPAEVRDVIGNGVPLYFLGTGPLTRSLANGLPPKLEVYGGACRIWWPGAGSSSDPHDHPLVHDRYGVYGSQALEQLRAAWARGPNVSEESAGQDPRLTLLTRERDQARSAQSGLQERVADAERERDKARTRAARAERDLREERRSARSTASSIEEGDDEDGETTFHVSMVESRGVALQTPISRGSVV